MPVQHLKLVPRLRVPDAARLVAARGDDFVALRIELDFADFVLVALKQRNARSRKDVVDPCHSVRACRRQFIASRVETRVQNLIVVTAESLDALTAAHIPQAASAIDTSCEAVIASEVELTAGELA